jgi:hypothetical protein
MDLESGRRARAIATTPPPGRRARAVATLAIGIGFALAGAGVTSGCAHRAETRRLPGWVFQSSRTEPAGGGAPARRRPRPQPIGGMHGRDESSDFVVAALQASGLRFGTDGSVPSLWGYLRMSHATVPAADARPGDILFFRLAPDQPGRPIACDAPDHAAIVATIEDHQRIAFIEERNGRTLRSYVDPGQPRLRRDAEGRVHNSFLRPPRIGEPLDSPLYAGEMLCAVARPR